MDYYQLFDMERELSMHQIRYKKNSGATDRSFGEERLQCADMCARVDEIMDTVHQYSKQC